MLSNAGTNGNHDTAQPATTALRESFATSFPVAIWGAELIIGVSGGSDSVALAHLAATANREAGGPSRICLAHLNHGLRGSESDGDEEFVRSLAAQLGAEFQSWKASLSGGNQGEGLESRLRDLRYQLLADLARSRSCRCIALGHHRDDQIETILFRIFRGTSLKGLQGIPPAREIETGISVVRPLLEVSRQQILDYLAEQGLSFRTDSSNLHNVPTRNWIRNDLLPQLADRFGPAVANNILRLAQTAEETTEMLESLSSELSATCLISKDEQSVELGIGPMKKAPPVIIRHMLVRLWTSQAWPLRGMSAAKWEELTDLIRSTATGNRQIILPGRITARRTDAGTIRLETGE